GENSIRLRHKVLSFHDQVRPGVAGSRHHVAGILDLQLVNKELIQLILRVIVQQVRVSAEQEEVNGYSWFTGRDCEVLRNPDHARRDNVVEDRSGPRTAVRVGEGSSTQELTCKKLVPMKVTFKVVRVGGMIGPASVPLVIQDKQVTCPTAASVHI